MLKFISPVAIVSLAAVFGYMFVVHGDQGVYTINITCPDGFMLAMNDCYLFNVKDQLTWNEARTECAIRNADLVVVRNNDSLNWLRIQTEAYKTDGWWVGLAHMADKWDWVQYGGDTTLIQWRHEPDNYDDQDCDAINEYGAFSDEYCSSQLGFICQYGLNQGESCPDDDPVNPSWFLTDRKCFYISHLINASLHLNWTTAQSFCSKLPVPAGKTVTLLSLDTADDVRSIKSLLSSFDKSGSLLPWWTGLNDRDTEGAYKWQDGTLANGNFITWDVAPNPDRSLQQNCGVMYQGGTIDDAVCDRRAHYVCEMSAYQAHLNLGCGSWLRAGSSCYLLGTGRGYSWSDARTKCISGGADLLKVDNFDEKAWVENLQLGGIGYWTGLRRAAANYTIWTWFGTLPANGSLINWSSEPNNNGGQEKCVEIHPDGLYNDRICSAKVGYICEYPVDYGTACPQGWQQCEKSSCYYFSPANASFAATWYEAKQKCQDMVPDHADKVTRLAVNDKTEQTCINNLLQALPEGAPGYWTDLNDLKILNRWQYDSSQNNPPDHSLITWVHEPNNANFNEACGVMYQGGSYNDLDCAAQAFFICEKPPNNLQSSGAVAYPRQLLALVCPYVLTYLFFYV